jgi:hypothetical protein
MEVNEAFYYDIDGQTIRLEPSGELAVDGAANLSPDFVKGLASLVQAGESLVGDLVMIDKATMDPELEGALDDARALQPVYRTADGTRVVVLPEVRVESNDEATVERIRAYASSDDTDAELVNDKGTSLVLRPCSGRGTDAIALANELFETYAPQVSQARFVRVVQRPETIVRSI